MESLKLRVTMFSPAPPNKFLKIALRVSSFHELGALTYLVFGSVLQNHVLLLNIMEKPKITQLVSGCLLSWSQRPDNGGRSGFQAWTSAGPQP